MNNVSQVIKQNSGTVSNNKETTNECPLNGNCKVHNFVYKCNVSGTKTFKESVFLRIAEGNCKGRFA